MATEGEGSAGGTMSIGEFAGSLLGDMPFDDAPDVTGAPAEGTPSPSESPDTPAPTDPPVGPDGDPAVDPQGTPPVSDPATPTVSVPSPDEDPLASATSATYTVDGVTKTYDGIKVLGDDGAIIDAAALPDLLRKLGERDHLFDTNQQLYTKVRDYDAVLTYRSGPSGKEQDYKGLDAFVQAQADARANAAAGVLLLKAINEAFPGPEHAEAKRALFERAAFEVERTTFTAAQAIRSQFQMRQQEVAQPVNEDSHVERSFQQISDWGQKNGLTADDVSELRQIFGSVKGALFRAATPQDAQQLGVRPGARIFDPAPANQWAIRRAKQNTDRAAQDKTRKVATTANAARLKAAITPKATTQTTPTRKAPAMSQREQDASDAWDLRERLASARLQGAG